MQRLRGRSRFAAVRAEGVAGRSRGMRVSLLPNGAAYSRAAIAVTHARGSVQRNRARRRLRAAVAALLPSHPGYDVVVHARADGPEERYEAVLVTLSAALSQARSRVRP